jgi:hypothetical protein
MPQRGGGATTVVVQPVATQTKATVLTRAFNGLKQVKFSQDDLADPETHHRLLTQIVQHTASVARSLSEDPTLAGVILQGLVFTAGMTRTLSHGLGRAYVGFRVEHADGAAPALYTVAQPAGVTSATSITIKSDNAGTFSVRVY